ncbi:hypothetical protein NC661_03620 [Aquibacillus koreensis]|uniref:Uncharacterized protein n=1 Tax=Aquibacillus koreensis TaxID=279446 RepID=A0A9X3WJG5_9BACI|nr:hypothetical protein [Aquibacillus koreensis]MCT2536461.1 hypothetical protein [Aquibacillus koreensis]MDC3419451.1 hypothetical protein [Aquibacillus koreensis]
MDRTKMIQIMVSITLLGIAIAIFPRYNELVDMGNMNQAFSYSLTLGIIYFLFGILIELDRLLHNKTFEIRWGALIPSIIIIALVSIPTSRWILWFGVGFPYPYNPFVYPELKAIATVVAGILFVRGIKQ